MSTDNARNERERHEQAARIASVLQQIKGHLEHERQRVVSEIRAYPVPIPACDAQFNYLLEEREQVAQELRQLEAWSKQPLAPAEAARRIGEFLAASRFATAELERSVRSVCGQLACSGTSDAGRRRESGEVP